MSDDVSTKTSREPRDRYFITYFLFYGFGVLSVINSHFFTTATDYWMYKFRDPNQQNYSSQNRTSIQAQFNSSYKISASVSTVIGIVITARLIRKITALKRLYLDLFGILVVFIVMVAFVKVDTDSWQHGFFIFTMIMVALISAFAGSLMLTVFEFASKFPPQYFAAIITGQTLCGIFSALAQILVLGVDADSETSGFIYFLIGTCFVLAVFVITRLANSRLEFFKFHVNKEQVRERVEVNKKLFMGLLNKVKWYLLAYFCIFSTNQLIYPNITSLVVSTDEGNGNKWNDRFFVPVISFLLYNVFDYMAREVARKVLQPSNQIVLLVLGACQLAFIPLVLFFNAQPRKHLPVAFDTDAGYIAFIICFSFSNAYLANISIIKMISVVDQKERMFATIFLLTVIIGVLVVVSALSVVLVGAL